MYLMPKMCVSPLLCVPLWSVSPETVMTPAPGPCTVTGLASAPDPPTTSGPPWVRVTVPLRPDLNVIRSDCAFTFASLMASRRVQPFTAVVHAPGDASGAVSASVLTSRFAACAAAGASANAPTVAPAAKPARRSLSC
jgi:hypothetical protein